MEQTNHAIERLTALMAAGYELQPVAGPADAVVLHFPARRFRYWCAYVYSSGQAVLQGTGDDEQRFYADDTQEAFLRFVSTVPKPTWSARSVRVPGIVHAAWIAITIVALALHLA